MALHTVVVRVLCFVHCFTHILTAHTQFRITRHTVCAKSVEGDLNLYRLSPEQCVIKCSLRSACVGLTYIRAWKKCTLYLSEESFEWFKISEEQSLQTDYYGNQCILINRSDIDVAELQPRKTCPPNSEYNMTTDDCTVQECPRLNIEGGLLHGNIRSVGSRLGYTCELDQPNTRQYASCLENGTWSKTPDCMGCFKFLLLSIPDEQITASSVWNREHDYLRDRLDIREVCLSGGIFRPGAWVASGSDKSSYIQAMFDDVVTVSGVVTKGRDKRCRYLQYVKTFTVSHSLDCLNNFTQILTNDGSIRVFNASTDDTELEVYNYIQGSIKARCVRLYPQDNETNIALRFDVIGCEEECSTLLVSGRYGVPNNHTTASHWDTVGIDQSVPQHARLDEIGGWFVREIMSENVNVYIQVRFRAMRHVVSIITQGVNATLHSPNHHMYTHIYTATYQVKYSIDCEDFLDVNDTTTNTIKVFNGNEDMNTKVENYLPEPVDALCVRIIPLSYNVRKGLRFDLKGCVDHVCPESATHSIRPHVRSSYKLVIYPEIYTYNYVLDVCFEKGGSLVNLDDLNKRQFITKMIQSCNVYSATSTYWVKQTLMDVLTPSCASLTDRGTLEVKKGDICPNAGIICEWTLSTV